jgi:hypothetical protein
MELPRKKLFISVAVQLPWAINSLWFRLVRVMASLMYSTRQRYKDSCSALLHKEYYGVASCEISIATFERMFAVPLRARGTDINDWTLIKKTNPKSPGANSPVGLEPTGDPALVDFGLANDGLK